MDNYCEKLETYALALMREHALLWNALENSSSLSTDEFFKLREQHRRTLNVGLRLMDEKPKTGVMKP